MFGSLGNDDDDLGITVQSFVKGPYDYKGEWEFYRMNKNKSFKIHKNMKLVPDDVIVHKIFSFAEIEVDPKNEFQLFGYFKHNKARRIFFLFKTLWIRKGFPKLMNWKKVNHVVIELRSSIYKTDEDNDRLIRQFKAIDFSHVRTLKLFMDPYVIKKQSPYEVVWQNSKFTELQYLLVSCCGIMRFYEKYGMNPMPKLKKLTYKYCSNVNDRLFQKHKFPLVESLKLYDLGAKGLDWCQMSNVKKLTLNGMRYLKDDVFTKVDAPFNFKNLLNLKLTYCKLVFGNGWQELPNLKRIVLFRAKEFTDAFFQQQELPSLEILKCENCDNLTGKEWKCKMKKLKYLYIRSSKLFEDEFFRTHEMENLEKLGLVCLPLLSGKDWKFMKSLAKFLHGGCTSVDDKIMNKNFSQKTCKRYDSNYHVGIKGL